MATNDKGAGYANPGRKLPQPSFSGFVKGLASEVFIHLGQVDNPITRTKVVNLDLAKYTISLIELIREKTKGNLSAEEQILIDNLLSQLRSVYEYAKKNEQDEAEDEVEA